MRLPVRGGQKLVLELAGPSTEIELANACLEVTNELVPVDQHQEMLRPWKLLEPQRGNAEEPPVVVVTSRRLRPHLVNFRWPLTTVVRGVAVGLAERMSRARLFEVSQVANQDARRVVSPLRSLADGTRASRPRPRGPRTADATRHRPC